jgi:uncharacterized membrane protein YfcA
LTLVILAPIASFIAGFVDAIAGGGGLITFPTLLFFNMPIGSVVGTNKMVSVCGTALASLTYYKNGLINKEIVKYAVPLVAIFSVLGAYTVISIPNEFLKPIVGLVLFGLCIYFFLKPKLGMNSQYVGYTTMQLLILLILMSTIGFYDGFFGPGTGMFMSYVFIKLLKMDFVNATANTKILNLTTNICSLIFFIILGKVEFYIAIPMSLANMLGGYLGAKSAIKSGNKFIRWIFLFMALALAIKYYYN